MKVRIANNKNIQTMEQKDIDIYEILKDEEYGTELYTPICGKVWHSGMANDKDSKSAILIDMENKRLQQSNNIADWAGIQFIIQR